MNFKKTVVLKTSNSENLKHKINDNVLASTVITSYHCKQLKLITEKFNSTNLFTFECDTQALNKGILQKLADYSFQEASTQKSFQDILVNVYQIKNLMKNPNTYLGDANFLNYDLENLITNTAEKFVNFKEILLDKSERNKLAVEEKFVEYNKQEPKKFSMIDVSNYANIPLEHLVNKNLLNKKLDLKPNQKLVFNGYLLKTNSLQQMRDRKFLELKKVDKPETELYDAAYKDQNENFDSNVNE